MKTLLFTEEHNQFREQIRRFFAKRVTPYAEQWDEKREIPRSIWKEMGELGFLGFCYDPKYGGAGADEIFRVVMGEELACAGSSGLTIAVAGHNDMATKYIDLMGNDEQKHRWLTPCITGDAVCAIAITEPGAGSDVASLTTRAEKKGDSYIINGQKTFITNGYYGDILVTAAKTDTNADPAYQGVSLFVIEKGMPGVSANKLEKVGCHASDTAEIFFEDVEVPAENLLGGEGEGFVAIMKNFQLERLSVGVLSVAIAQHILDKTLEYARERIVFKKPISKFQVIKHQLVDMALEIEMNRAFVYQCAYHYARGEDVTKEISMLKISAAEMVNRIAYRATQIYGGYGFMAEYEVARLYADLRPVTIAGGTTEIMKELVSRYLGI
ncbi:MAG TPA: acyl-CoA dehydrogenase family protein [Syntrophales bacterium]|mgnify:CR=1 FL=1|nr:acyl-CoA dehydrogenase family protein [Syntrophales bacterium]